MAFLSICKQVKPIKDRGRKASSSAHAIAGLEGPIQFEKSIFKPMLKV
jgi:hypothetical protein